MKAARPSRIARRALSERVAFCALALGACACSGSPAESPAAPSLRIVSAGSAPLHAFAGDAVALKLVEVDGDGSVKDLPPGAKVAWTLPSVVTALDPESTAASPLPAAGAEPTAAWLANPGRPDRTDDLANVLFILDPGTVQNAVVEVSASVSGVAEVADAGTVTASLEVDPTPAGDWTRGATLYGVGGANCAECHGATGQGSPEGPGATSFTLGGASYDFPAPGLNAEPGNAAGDPAWNAALFAVAARADIDNGGLTLRAPMPDWLATPNPTTGKPLSTQDLADIYAFLKTQTH